MGEGKESLGREEKVLLVHISKAPSKQTSRTGKFHLASIVSLGLLLLNPDKLKNIRLVFDV